jgi:hypothetical protein
VHPPWDLAPVRWRAHPTPAQAGGTLGRGTANLEGGRGSVGSTSRFEPAPPHLFLCLRHDPNPEQVMSTVAPHAESTRCASCHENPDRLCKSCAARRRAAVRCFEQRQQAVEEIARQMRLSTWRVMRLIEESYDRRALHALGEREIAIEVVRERFEAWRREDPEGHTFLELARLAGFGSSSRVQRLLGTIPTSTVVKGGVVDPRIRLCSQSPTWTEVLVVVTVVLGWGRGVCGGSSGFVGVWCSH